MRAVDKHGHALGLGHAGECLHGENDGGEAHDVVQDDQLDLRRIEVGHDIPESGDKIHTSRGDGHGGIAVEKDGNFDDMQVANVFDIGHGVFNHAVRHRKLNENVPGLCVQAADHRVDRAGGLSEKHQYNKNTFGKKCQHSKEQVQ
jgi:hypothetical protein